MCLFFLSGVYWSLAFLQILKYLFMCSHICISESLPAIALYICWFGCVSVLVTHAFVFMSFSISYLSFGYFPLYCESSSSHLSCIFTSHLCSFAFYAWQSAHVPFSPLVCHFLNQCSVYTEATSKLSNLLRKNPNRGKWHRISLSGSHNNP